MKITISTIDHRAQRYPTVGDWWFDPRGRSLTITVSRMSDSRSEMAVAVHELVEALLCDQAGITTGDVDRFDMRFEAGRRPGDEREPGDQPDAPYHLQHTVATTIERVMVQALGLTWHRHEAIVSAAADPVGSAHSSPGAATASSDALASEGLEDPTMIAVSVTGVDASAED